MSSEHYISLIEKVIWPLFLVTIYWLNRKSFKRILVALVSRIESGAEVQISTIKVGKVPVSLPSPINNEMVTKNHLALLHSSWRYPKKDKEYGAKMYIIQVILQANTNVLDRIEYVKYYLHDSYPNNIQTITSRINNFELKELAWGESNIDAEVKVKGQQELINLSRYINLSATGKRLLNR